jgi:hypothetical protein
METNLPNLFEPELGLVAFMILDGDKLQAALIEAATDPSRWNAAMDTAAEITGGVGSILLPIQGRLPNAPFSESVGELAHSYFRDGWSQREARRALSRGRHIDAARSLQ